MRDVLLSTLPNDLTGKRILDAGCGTGALSVELAKRGAQVVGIDISPALIDIAEKRCPRELRGLIEFKAGDMTANHGAFDHAIAMDSMIYYTPSDLATTLAEMGQRAQTIAFTVAPKTPLLMMMWRAGKLFPRGDKSPVMVPQSVAGLAHQMRDAKLPGTLKEVERVTSGFYISTALEYRP